MRQGSGIVSGGTLQMEGTRREGTLSGASQGRARGMHGWSETGGLGRMSVPSRAVL